MGIYCTYVVKQPPIPSIAQTGILNINICMHARTHPEHHNNYNKICHLQHLKIGSTKLYCP